VRAGAYGAITAAGGRAVAAALCCSVAGAVGALRGFGTCARRVVRPGASDQGSVRAQSAARPVRTGARGGRGGLRQDRRSRVRRGVHTENQVVRARQRSAVAGPLRVARRRGKRGRYVGQRTENGRRVGRSLCVSAGIVDGVGGRSRTGGG